MGEVSSSRGSGDSRCWGVICESRWVTRGASSGDMSLSWDDGPDHSSSPLTIMVSPSPWP